MSLLRRSLRHVLIAFLLGASQLQLHAQDRDSVAAKMGLTRESGSLPVWESPSQQAVQKLSATVRNIQAGVFLVGNERGYGTAFVISRKHRLLATNAHVADILHETGPMLAIQNDTTRAFEVEKVWYHPGVRRALRGSFPVRSQNPADGHVDDNSPDVAVLQLAEGANLPIEFELATVQELNDLFAQPVGMLGYPGHDTIWPTVGERPVGTFREGVICRLTNFFGRADSKPAELQRVQHSMMSYAGFSGSPIFLPNGHVAALHNSGQELAKGTRIQHGVRVDCLWELLVYHKLDELVPIGMDRSGLPLERFQKSDPEEERFRNAMALEVEAKLLIANGKFAEAVEKCNQAIKLAPGFADAYYTRGNAFNDSAQQRKGLSRNQKLQYMDLALADSKKYCQMSPSDLEGLIELCVTTCNWTNEKTGSQRNSDAAAIITKLLQSGSLNAELRSRAHRTRAQANAWDETTLPDLNEAIRIRPFEEYNYLARSYYWQDRGNVRKASADRKTYERLKTAERLRMERASEPDFKKKVELARQTCEQTEWAYWLDIQRLAVMSWAAGFIENAVKFQTKAVEMAPDEEKPKARMYLKQMNQDLEKQ